MTADIWGNEIDPIVKQLRDTCKRNGFGVVIAVEDEGGRVEAMSYNVTRAGLDP